MSISGCILETPYKYGEYGVIILIIIIPRYITNNINGICYNVLGGFPKLCPSSRKTIKPILETHSRISSSFNLGVLLVTFKTPRCWLYEPQDRCNLAIARLYELPCCVWGFFSTILTNYIGWSIPYKIQSIIFTSDLILPSLILEQWRSLKAAKLLHMSSASEATVSEW